jgi:outer membrane protein assembly factor BamA
MVDEIPVAPEPLSSTAASKSPSLQTLKSVSPSVKVTVLPLSLVGYLIMTCLQTSLKYVWTAIDDRDSTANPSKGSLLETAIEVATRPGTAEFLKSDLTAQFHRPLSVPYKGGSPPPPHPVPLLNFFLVVSPH